MGGIAAVLLFVSVLLHELGHSYVALRYQIPIQQITLFVFGGMAQMKREPPGPRAEFLIAIAGPIVSFALGALCLGFVSLAESAGLAPRLRGLLVLGGLLGMVNVQLGLFNLIPGFPLDGGRVLRAGLWAWNKDFYRATRHASMIGLGIAMLIGLLGATMVVAALVGLVPTALVTNGGWVVVIAAFLFAAARTSQRQAALRSRLASVSVQDLMVRKVVTLPPDLTIDVAVNQYFLPLGYGGFPVMEDGRLVGLVTVRDVQALPTSLWPWRRVREVMVAVSSQLVVSPGSSVMMALDQMLQQGSDRMIVMEGDQLVGLVTRSAIGHFLQLRGAQSGA
jgi:Zn-dependent protease/predicted transcriptional regulator